VETAFATWPTVPQVARELHIAPLTVYHAIERGRIVALRTNLGLLVNPESAAEYARTRRPVRQKGVKVA
jgi:hypothetical protein